MTFHCRVQEHNQLSSAPPMQHDFRKLSYHEPQNAHCFLSNCKMATDLANKELDEKRSSLIQSSPVDLFPTTKLKTLKSARKRRIYSDVHLDPKKSGRRFRANDRERRRMESLNGALNALKGCIPLPKTSKRMTKLRVLRCACNYIRSLSELLEAATGMMSCPIESTNHARERMVNGLSVGQRLGILSQHTSRFY